MRKKNVYTAQINVFQRFNTCKNGRVAVLIAQRDGLTRQLAAEKDGPHCIKIERKSYLLIFNNFAPRALHIGVFVDVVDYNDGVVCHKRQTLAEIVDCGLAAVVAVNKNKIEAGQTLQRLWQCLGKLRVDKGYIIDSKQFKSIGSNFRQIWAALNGYKPAAIG